jgi:hypothetical protein
MTTLRHEIPCVEALVSSHLLPRRTLETEWLRLAYRTTWRPCSLIYAATLDRHKNRPVVMEEAVVASHKPNQKQDGNFLPQGLAMGKENARTAAIRTQNETDPAHGTSTILPIPVLRLCQLAHAPGRVVLLKNLHRLHKDHLSAINRRQVA